MHDLIDVGAHMEAPVKRCRGQDGACWSNGDVGLIILSHGLHYAKKYPIIVLSDASKAGSVLTWRLQSRGVEAKMAPVGPMVMYVLLYYHIVACQQGGVCAHMEAPVKRCRGQDGACWSNGDVIII